MKKINKTKDFFYLLFLLITTLFIANNSYAQVVEKVDTATQENLNLRYPSIFTSWQKEEILHIHLTTDMKEFVKEKKEEKRQDATLTYTDKDGKENNHSVKIRARGNMRKDICSFPPIKMYFSKDYLDSVGFNKKFNDYKLVIGCKSQSMYEDYLLKEYLIYKLYNQMTAISYRVQLIHLTIEDSEDNRKTIESFGFIIENDEEMAERLNGELIDPKILSPRAIIPEHYDRMAIFQFMIGNTDWYMYNKHNMKIIKRVDDSYPIIIPYDFDYSGIINANYAVPHEKLPIEFVRQRFFLGMCREDGAYEPTLQLFRDKKEEILATCNNFEHLDPKAKEDMIDYLIDFFTILEDQKKTRRDIIEHCDQHVKIE